MRWCLFWASMTGRPSARGANGDGVAAELPLPIAGLMSDRPLAEVYERLTRMEAMLLEMGVTLSSPFMSISFLALSVIPDLKLTDRGLVDVKNFRLLPLEAG